MSEPPLHETIRRVSTAVEYLDLRAGIPRTGPERRTRCSDVDESFFAEWEARIAQDMLRDYGRADPLAASGFAPDWYAGVSGRIGGALFRTARRVPRLERDALAFTWGDGEGHHPVALAVLDDRFWCLPTDPDAGHPSSTVVADTASLAAVLRAQVRAHAHDFLAGYSPDAACSVRSSTPSAPGSGTAGTPAPRWPRR